MICVGNRLRRDDGFGPAVYDELRLMGVEAIESWGEGTELMQAWEGFDHVIIVDAAQSGKAPPGSLHYFNATDQEIPRDFFHYTTHRFGVAEAIELARSLGELPRKVEVYAVEGDDFSQGEGLSEEVLASVQKLVEKLIKSF